MKAPGNAYLANSVEGETKAINSELWHACAGPLVSLPPIGSLVVYFPQGHSEQVAASMQKQTDGVPSYPNLPSKLICMMHSVILHANPDTDDVYAQMTLQPVNKYNQDAVLLSDMGLKQSRQPAEFFCKTLTASDTSTHGGFSVPRRAAEKIFPPLDFSMQPPAQELTAKDLHDQTWTFKHIYRGQPKRHLLTTGWSVFVSSKRLMAGDSVLFIRDEKARFLLGIRRANRQTMTLSSSVVSSDSMHIGILAAGAHAAANNSPFTIFYNPRASPYEFVIPLAKYNKAMYTPVSLGMRFRMMFETEESGVRRYMGTITSITDLDPVRWKGSQWRNLQVGWDESTAGARPSRVSIWEIEPVVAPFYICPPFFGPKFAKRHGYPDEESDMESLYKRGIPWIGDDFGQNNTANSVFPGFNLIQWMNMQQNNMLSSAQSGLLSTALNSGDHTNLLNFQSPTFPTSNFQFGKVNQQSQQVNNHLQHSSLFPHQQQPQQQQQLLQASVNSQQPLQASVNSQQPLQASVNSQQPQQLLHASVNSQQPQQLLQASVKSQPQQLQHASVNSQPQQLLHMSVNSQQPHQLLHMSVNSQQPQQLLQASVNSQHLQQLLQQSVNSQQSQQLLQASVNSQQSQQLQHASINSNSQQQQQLLQASVNSQPQQLRQASFNSQQSQQLQHASVNSQPQQLRQASFNSQQSQQLQLASVNSKKPQQSLQACVNSQQLPQQQKQYAASSNMSQQSLCNPQPLQNISSGNNNGVSPSASVLPSGNNNGVSPSTSVLQNSRSEPHMEPHQSGLLQQASLQQKTAQIPQVQQISNQSLLEQQLQLQFLQKQVIQNWQYQHTSLPHQQLIGNGFTTSALVPSPHHPVVNHSQQNKSPIVIKGNSGLLEGDVPSCSTSPSTNNCHVSSSSKFPCTSQPGPVIDPATVMVQDFQTRSDSRSKYETNMSKGTEDTRFRRNVPENIEPSSSGTSYLHDTGGFQQNYALPTLCLDDDIHLNSRSSVPFNSVVDSLAPDALLSRGYESGKDIQNLLADYGGDSRDIETELSAAGFGVPNLSFKPSCSNNDPIDEAGILNNGLWANQTQRMRTYTKVQKRGSVGRTIDVTRYKGYNELSRDLARMFGLEGQLEDLQRSEWKLVYVDHENDILLVGDDPWEEFVSCVQSIKILSSLEVQQMSLDGNLPNLSFSNQVCSGTDSGNTWKGHYDDNSEFYARQVS